MPYPRGLHLASYCLFVQLLEGISIVQVVNELASGKYVSKVDPGPLD